MGGEILLTQRAREPFKGYWALLSGIGESKKGIPPEIGVVEEVNCDLQTESFQGKYAFSVPIENDPVTDEAVVFIGSVNEAEINPNPEFSRGYKWVPLGDNETLSNLAFEHSRIMEEYRARQPQ